MVRGPKYCTVPSNTVHLTGLQYDSLGEYCGPHTASSVGVSPNSVTVPDFVDSDLHSCDLHNFPIRTNMLFPLWTVPKSIWQEISYACNDELFSNNSDSQNVHSGMSHPICSDPSPPKKTVRSKRVHFN